MEQHPLGDVPLGPAKRASRALEEANVPGFRGSERPGFRGSASFCAPWPDAAPDAVRNRPGIRGNARRAFREAVPGARGIGPGFFGKRSRELAEASRAFGEEVPGVRGRTPGHCGKRPLPKSNEISPLALVRRLSVILCISMELRDQRGGYAFGPGTRRACSTKSSPSADGWSSTRRM